MKALLRHPVRYFSRSMGSSIQKIFLSQILLRHFTTSLYRAKLIEYLQSR